MSRSGVGHGLAEPWDDGRDLRPEKHRMTRFLGITNDVDQQQVLRNMVEAEDRKEALRLLSEYHHNAMPVDAISVADLRELADLIESAPACEVFSKLEEAGNGELEHPS